MKFVPPSLSAAITHKLTEKGTILLAIDGPCGGGKSTLAEVLRVIYQETGSTLFHMDDFFLQPHQRIMERLEEPGGNVDRERFLREVLLEIKRGKPFVYNHYDCQKGTMKAVFPSPARLMIIEGVYSLHPELRAFYDIKVFLDIDADRQLERLRERVQGDKLHLFVNEWIPMENRYFEAFQVRNTADLVLIAGD
jgi:uridine kinase